jgi:hypothetical protein
MTLFMTATCGREYNRLWVPVTALVCVLVHDVAQVCFRRQVPETHSRPTHGVVSTGREEKAGGKTAACPGEADRWVGWMR